MKPINFIHPALCLGHTKGRGRGVFSNERIRKKTIIEVAPVIVMTGQDRTFIDQTLLHDYIFEWGEESRQCCMALGYAAVYNHSARANCEYEMYFDDQLITIKTVRDIDAGEELFINYHGDWNDERPVWFELK